MLGQAAGRQTQSNIADPALQIADTPTLSPIPPTATIQPPSSTASPIVSLATSVASDTTRLFAFIQAPVGFVPEPFVILTAFSTVPGSGQLSIRGFTDGRQFVCDATPCRVVLQGNARFTFRAYDEFGHASDEVLADVSLTQSTDGYLVTINHVSQFTTFVDACSVTWGLGDETNATWDSFVQFPLPKGKSIEIR